MIRNRSQHAFVAAGRALDGNLRDVPQAVAELIKDVAAKILECGRADVLDIIEKAVVQEVTDTGDLATEEAEVDQHARRGVWIPGDGDFDVVGVAVDATARLGVDFPLEGMCRLEVELLAQFE